MEVTTALTTDQQCDTRPKFDASLADAHKCTEHEQLWKIFTTYALQLSSEDPTRMRVGNVVHLLQDCGIIDSDGSMEARIMEKDVEIVCGSFVKHYPSDHEGSKKIHFTAFLALLQYLSKMSGELDQEKAYESLVRTCLERHKRARVRTNVMKEYKECQKLLEMFNVPLAKMFAYYAKRTFEKLEKAEPGFAKHCPAHMSYAECLAFAKSYGIIAPDVLTTTDFAALYADSLPRAPLDEYKRVLVYEGFLHLLVRLAVKMCDDSNVPAGMKLKALFQLMWLASAPTHLFQTNMQQVIKTDRTSTTTLNSIFSDHFEKFWRKEKCENYISILATKCISQDDSSKYHLIMRLAQPKAVPSPPPTPLTRRASLIQASSEKDQMQSQRVFH